VKIFKIHTHNLQFFFKI